jgi:hypothetical protein
VFDFVGGGTGSDYKGRLLEYIDAEALPKEWGGTCVCNPATGIPFLCNADIDRQAN